MEFSPSPSEYADQEPPRWVSIHTLAVMSNARCRTVLREPHCRYRWLQPDARQSLRLRDLKIIATVSKPSQRMCPSRRIQ